MSYEDDWDYQWGFYYDLPIISAESSHNLRQDIKKRYKHLNLKVAQIDILCDALVNGYDISILVSHRFNQGQMRQIVNALRHLKRKDAKFTLQDVKKYADIKYQSRQMAQRFLWLIEGIDLSILDNCVFSVRQMWTIRSWIRIKRQNEQSIDGMDGRTILALIQLEK